MKRYVVVAALAALLVSGVVSAVAAPSPKSQATITFTLSTTGGLHPTCHLTITSSKDISNYTVNGVKTEGITVSTITIDVKNGDRITVKSGTTTVEYTVTGCAAGTPGPHHGGGDAEDHHGTDGHGTGHHGGDHLGQTHNASGGHH